MRARAVAGIGTSGARAARVTPRGGAGTARARSARGRPRASRVTGTTAYGAATLGGAYRDAPHLHPRGRRAAAALLVVAHHGRGRVDGRGPPAVSARPRGPVQLGGVVTRRVGRWWARRREASGVRWWALRCGRCAVPGPWTLAQGPALVAAWRAGWSFSLPLTTDGVVCVACSGGAQSTVYGSRQHVSRGAP